MNGVDTTDGPTPTVPMDGEMTFGELIHVLRARLWMIALASILVGGAAFGITFAIAPTFTASTNFMPPQQAQSGAASALASLGALGGLAAGAVGVKSPAEQYVSLMQSVTVSDRLVDQYKLMGVYEAKLRVEAREELARRVRISVGKKDGLISVEVDDTDPARAAAMANSYVEELRRMTSLLAVTEAQQRRAFFEMQLKQTRDRLVTAQEALQSSGFNPGALKAEPKAAAEAFARLKAELTATEVRLETLRSSLVEGAPEVRQQRALAAALREQLSKASATTEAAGGPDYISRYREYKYQESLFELFARQFEQARIDESREGGLIQVVDVATPPERKSKPKRSLIALAAAFCTAVAMMVFFVGRHSLRQPRAR